jgi:serine protease Do
MPADEAAAPAAADAPRPGSTLDGLTLENLSDANRRAFQVSPEVTRGVVITRIDNGSAAARAGLRPGDVLLEIDRQPIDGVDAFKRSWSSAKGKVLVLVHRRGATTYLVVER